MHYNASYTAASCFLAAISYRRSTNAKYQHPVNAYERMANLKLAPADRCLQD